MAITELVPEMVTIREASSRTPGALVLVDYEVTQRFGEKKEGIVQ